MSKIAKIKAAVGKQLYIYPRWTRWDQQISQESPENKTTEKLLQDTQRSPSAVTRRQDPFSAGESKCEYV